MRKKNEKIESASNEISVINHHSAGIDIGSKENWVSVSPTICEDHIRKFGSYTCDLNAIADWLTSCKVTTVAMESTGIYWIPLYEILESRGFKLSLCNAKHVKNAPGRKKTDKFDCDWLRKLHSYGLLTPSFIPEKNIREIKVLTRYRDKLVKENNIHIQHMQKALTLMNFYLHQVISDITGKTGMSIIKAILSGETNPEVLVSYKKKGIKKSNEEIIKALSGSLQFEQLYILKQAVNFYEFFLSKIEETDSQINNLFLLMSQPIDEDNISIEENDSNDINHNIVQAIGVDLCEIPGLNILSVEKLIGETGFDMSKWKNSKNFTSWLGLSPNHRITGGTVFQNSTNKVQSNAASIFRQCATTLRNSHSYLGAFFRKKMAQIGYQKAITATSRKIAVIYYTMIRYKKSYSELGENFYEELNRKKMEDNFKKLAKKLGYEIKQVV